MCLLLGLENRIRESELLTIFTSQNKSENKNWNYDTHLKLEIENGKRIANRLGNQSAIF